MVPRWELQDGMSLHPQHLYCRPQTSLQLFIYGKNHFSSLKNCQSWDYPTGVIYSFAFKPLFGHRELSVGKVLGAAPHRMSLFY